MKLTIEQIRGGIFRGKNAIEWHNLGVDLFEDYKPELAIENFEIAVMLNPTEDAFWLMLGQCCSLADYPRDALEICFKRAEMLDPENNAQELLSNWGTKHKDSEEACIAPRPSRGC